MFTRISAFRALLPARHYRKVAAKPTVPRPRRASHIGPPFITCHRPELDLHLGDHIRQDAKLGTIPLCSDRWTSRKSKGDFFQILPHIDADHESVARDAQQPFESFGLHPQLVENIVNRIDLRTTTYIQHAAMPVILSSKHALIAAETGCGKTIAYLLPILDRLLKHRSKSDDAAALNTPRALIITPSRELAQQIGGVCEQMCHNTELKSKVIIGGHTKSIMMNPSMDNIDILIASMGALSKLITTRVYKMDAVRHVVLDEADTLLDDSFAPKVRYILRRFPFHNIVLRPNDPTVGSTQLILASATMPENAQEALETIIDPKTIEHVVSPYLHRIMPNITQKFLRIGKGERPFELLRMAKQMVDKRRPLIVFSNYRDHSQFLAHFLNDNGVETASLVKNDFDGLRGLQFRRFQMGQAHVLCTTDLSSRGLDTRRAHHVLNYDFPWHIADYIHRCGRIGRVSSADNCRVTSFVSQQFEVPLVQKIEHSARTERLLPDVNANIAGTLENRAKHRQNREDKQFFHDMKLSHQNENAN